MRLSKEARKSKRYLYAFNEQDENQIMYKFYTDHYFDDKSGERTKLHLKIGAIIQNELTDIEKKTVDLYFNKRVNMIIISQKLGVNKSTVSRNLKRAKNKLRSFIKYAI